MLELVRVEAVAGRPLVVVADVLVVAAGVVVWGSMYAWEMGVWVIMTFVLILPMILAGVLFLLSARAELLRSLRAAAAMRSLRVDAPHGVRGGEIQPGRH